MDTRIVIGLVVALLSCHSESSPYLHRGLQTLSLEEIVPLKPDFYPDRLNVQWISDTAYIFKDADGIKKYDASTDSFVTIVSEIDLYNLFNYSISTFSEDGRYALLTKNRKKVYRYSSTAEYAVYDIENKLIRKLGSGVLQVVIWGKPGALAYVKNNNVYYVPDIRQNEAHNLTIDGVPGEVYYGAADWIYEEEVFNAAEAMWFSPKGTYLAVAVFDDTNVESAVYPNYGDASDINNQYPELVEFKYPKASVSLSAPLARVVFVIGASRTKGGGLGLRAYKIRVQDPELVEFKYLKAGRDNPKVGLRVYKVDEPRSEPWNIPAPVDVVGLDHIIGRVSWASEENLVVLWLNRRQNISILVNCNLKKDKCSMVKEQRETNGWIDINDPFFDSRGTKMVDIEPLFHGDQRFNHASRFNFLTLTTEDLSPGNSTVQQILGWNQETDTVYYVVAPGTIPWLRQIWATSGGVVRCVTCKEPSCRYASGEFAPGAKYGVITCGACNIPPKTFLYNSNEDSFKLINDNSRLSLKLQQYSLPMTLYNVLSLGDDLMANTKMLLPPDFRDGEKYPMIVRVYAGPGTSRVKDNFDLEYYNSYLASNRSFIVASIDVRGSGAMGVDALHAVNGALGTVEITDTLATIRSLAALYPFIDAERIGVWGWSYGGFVTTMLLMQDDLDTIACGAAVAPVTSWLYYDTIYTERYMDTPQANPAGYKRSELTALAERLRGKRYMLVHGTGDDNVHYQHSMQLAKKLQHSDIAFEQISYTDENHSLLGVSRHFYHALDRFWTECFK